jgi:hypothetical protein
VGDLVAQLTGVHNFKLGSALTLHLTRRRPSSSVPTVACSGPRRTARKPDMARIDLDLAHSYRADPQRRRGLRAAAAEDALRRRRRLCAARALGLRQDDDAQHHLGSAAASQGRVLFDGATSRG